MLLRVLSFGSPNDVRCTACRAQAGLSDLVLLLAGEPNHVSVNVQRQMDIIGSRELRTTNDGRLLPGKMFEVAETVGCFGQQDRFILILLCQCEELK
jgi:hypothetical protein